MASSSTQPSIAAKESILTPVTTLEGHEPWNNFPPNHKSHPDSDSKYISSISYFPDGEQMMISGSGDKTIRRWDLQEGKEIKEAREVCENGINAVGVSRDGRWVVTADYRKLKVTEVETGIVRTFHEDDWIGCIDISADSTLLAGGSHYDGTARIWNLDTSELVAAFKFGEDFTDLSALRLSEDSRKLALVSQFGLYIQVWDIQAQKVNVQKSAIREAVVSRVAPEPVFWTTKDKSIVAAFNLGQSAVDYGTTTIYEFDASTLQTVGAPFEGHTDMISGLSLSSDCALLASSSYDTTIKFWAFESRQLLASFDFKNIPFNLVLSPDSRQLAYTLDTKICICRIPVNILATIGLAEEPQPSKRPHRAGLLDSDATCRPVRRKAVIIPDMSPIPHPQRPLPRDPHTFLRFLRNLFPSSSRTDAVRTDEPRNPLDFPATCPLPHPLTKPDESSRPTPAPPTTQTSAINTRATLTSSLHRISTWWPFQTDHASPAIVDVPLAPGKLRYATAGAPRDDDDLIRDEDYVSPPPSPNPGSRARTVNAGQHGSSRFCLCF